MPSNTDTVNMLPTYKIIKLPIGPKIHNVHCSFVELGGKYFSIQLKDYSNELIEMSENLQTYPLKHLENVPKIGMPVVAKFVDDTRLYRAKIVKILTTGCNVEYVDYGNVREVDKSDIYEMPSEFLEQPEYSIRFSLFGYNDLEPISMKQHDFFKNVVLEDAPVLQLIVKPSDTRSYRQFCNLYYKGQNILQLMKDVRDINNNEPLCY